MEPKELTHIARSIFTKMMYLIILVFPIDSSANVVINEIAWMGQKDSYSKEWIELYNPTETEVSLNQWTLQITKTKIPLKGIIKAKSYYLLEKTNDNTVIGEQADLIFKKAFNNKGEVISLIDSNGKTTDSLDCSKGWFAGDNKTKQTMERIDPLVSGENKSNWQTSKDEGGTPKKENVIIVSKKEEPSENVNQATEENQETKSIPLATYLMAGVVAAFSSLSALMTKRLLKH
jgi:hypothetical protein